MPTGFPGICPIYCTTLVTLVRIETYESWVLFLAMLLTYWVTQDKSLPLSLVRVAGEGRSVSHFPICKMGTGILAFFTKYSKTYR